MLQIIALAEVSTALIAARLSVDAPRPVPIVDLMTGADSKTDHASVEFAADPRSWYSIWQEYRGMANVAGAPGLNVQSLETAPSVDFDHNMIIAVFGGYAASSGYQIAESFEQKKRIHIRLEPVSAATSNVRLLLNPYAFIVLKRTSETVLVEFPGPDRNGNPSWVTVGSVGGRSAGRG